jgi:hypothetical protein
MKSKKEASLLGVPNQQVFSLQNHVRFIAITSPIPIHVGHIVVAKEVHKTLPVYMEHRACLDKSQAQTLNKYLNFNP